MNMFNIQISPQHIYGFICGMFFLALAVGIFCNMRKSIKYIKIHFWLIILVTISFATSICAVANVFTVEKTSVESFYGILVAVLGVLVTLLVGWQIWSVIDVRSVMRKCDLLEKTMQNKIDESLNNYDMVVSAYMQLLRAIEMKHHDSSSQEIMRVIVIGYQLASNGGKYKNDAVDFLSGFIVEYSKNHQITMCKNDKEELMKLFDKLKISDTDEVRKIIGNATVV